MADSHSPNPGSPPSDDDLLRVPTSDNAIPSDAGSESASPIVEEIQSGETVVRTYFPDRKTEPAPAQASIPEPPPAVGTSLPPDPPLSEPTQPAGMGGTQSIAAPSQPVEWGGMRDQPPPKTKKGKKSGASCLVLIVGSLAVVILISVAGYLAWRGNYLDLAVVDDLLAQLTPQAEPPDEQPDSMAATPPPGQTPGVLIEPSSPAPSATPAIGVTRVLDTPQSPAATTIPTATPVITTGTDEEIEQNGTAMVYLAGGTFTMGSGTGSRERAHQVTLDAYYMDKFEVTNIQWAACFSAGACGLPVSPYDYNNGSYYGQEEFDNYPVIYVTWTQANAYCQWRGARLPTEAEWEMAARWNPATSEVTTYPWGDDWDSARLNFCDRTCLLRQNATGSFDDGWPQMAPVGSFPSGASPSGVLDMAGNVAEWVSDWFSSSYYAASPANNPTGPASGIYRVVRGGAWGVGDPRFFTTYSRSAFPPGEYNPGLGFRCTISADRVNP